MRMAWNCSIKDWNKCPPRIPISVTTTFTNTFKAILKRYAITKLPITVTTQATVLSLSEDPRELNNEWTLTSNGIITRITLS